MNISQAIVKLKNDIITWCTYNFRNKADVADLRNLELQISGLEPHPSHTSRTMSSPVRMTVDSKGHVTALSASTHVRSITASNTSGVSIGTVSSCNSSGTTSTTTLYAPTISTMCQTQDIVLTKNKQYGDTPPSNPSNGQLFFLKVEEE